MLEDKFCQDLKYLNLTPHQKMQIVQLHLGARDPEKYPSVKNWIGQCFNKPRKDELLMKAYDEILEGYGVEALEGEWQNGYWCNIVATYVNMGDSCLPTIIHHRELGFIVRSLDDLIIKMLKEETP